MGQAFMGFYDFVISCTFLIGKSVRSLPTGWICIGRAQRQGVEKHGIETSTILSSGGRGAELLEGGS
jgi:hypothetical protein